MNSSLHFLTDQKKTDKADLLAPFKSVFFQYFEQLVDGCCMRIDLEFGMHYGKEREQINKEHYKNLLEYLRSARVDLKRSYLSKIIGSFDLSDRKRDSQSPDNVNRPAVALASDDLVRENYISTLIIRQCEQMYREDLARLNQLIAALLKKSAISDRQNPVAPEYLIKTFFEVVKSFKLNSNQRVALYKAFDANVFSQMGFIYRELINHCESSIMKLKADRRDIDGIIKPAATTAETNIVEFQQLQANLALWRGTHTPSGYDPIPATGDNFYEHFEIKNALHILGKYSTQAVSQPEMEKHPLKWHVIKTLDGINFSDETKILAKTDEDILDLISLIFAGIAGNAFLSDFVKTTILQLEIPMAAACLDQFSVFINPLNPIRRLLDDLVAAGQFLNSNNETDRLVLERISKITNKLVSENGFTISCWLEIAKDFSQFMARQQQSCRVHEDSSIRSMIDRETLSPEHREVFDLLEINMKNKSLPPIIIDFLQNVWQDVMLNDYLVKGRQPELWEKSVQTMRELIVSVTPPADDNERRHILKSIPGMLKELRSGLKRIDYDKEEKNRFFKELVVLHIVLMDKKLDKKTDTGTGKENQELDFKLELNSEAITDLFSHQVNDLKEGDWVAFDLDATRYWGKLARKAISNENLLFLSKNGEKILQIEAKDLAELFRRKQATLSQFNALPMTESVLSKLTALKSAHSTMKTEHQNHENFCDN